MAYGFKFHRGLILGFERSLATELLKEQMASDVDVDGIESQPVAQQFLKRALGAATGG